MGDTILDPEIPEIETVRLPWADAPENVLFYEKIYEDGHLGAYTESAEIAYKLGWLDNTIPKDEVRQSDVNGYFYRKEVCPMKTPEAIQREEYTAEIRTLKKQLADTDYKAIKYAEGVMTDEDYQATGIQRQAWRRRINELETLIGDGS
jgi:hypothetical protein